MAVWRLLLVVIVPISSLPHRADGGTLSVTDEVEAPITIVNRENEGWTY